jgi:polyhydroxybutyrate depolymerase
MQIIKQHAFGVGVIFISMLTAGTGEPQASEGRLYDLSDGARDRTHLLYRPENLSRQIPAPLVIVLHSGFGSSQQAEKSYNWDGQADRHGFIVAYPNGIN